MTEPAAPPRLAVVETLYETNCRSIPDMLRDSADTVESETDEDERTVAIVAVQIGENGTVKIYGWGETNDVHSLALLARGQHELLSILADQ